MKNFDTMLAQDREFTVGGETFHWHYTRPEVLELFAETTKLEGWPLLDAQVLLFVEESEHDRWREIRARDENAMPIGQLNAVITWLVEQQSNFPTEQPSPSASGRGQTAAISKAA